MSFYVYAYKKMKIHSLNIILKKFKCPFNMSHLIAVGINSFADDYHIDR
jgi:hypothetical protein